MADPLTMMMLAGTALSAGGTIAGGSAAAASGKMAREGLEFKAKTEEQSAQESRAGSQRLAIDKRREAGLVQSRLIARAAASGGGASDPGITDLAGDIAGRGEYQALLEMYKGENRARGLEDAAAASRLAGERAEFEGKAKRNASYLTALGTIIGGGGSAYKTYNRLPEFGPGYGHSYGSGLTSG